MDIPEERLKRLLTYCKVTEPEPEDIAEITELYFGAVGYMTEAGIAEPPSSNELRKAQYDICVNYLVLDAYEERRTTITGTIVADNPSFRRRINQLKLSEPDVSNSDTERM